MNTTTLYMVTHFPIKYVRKSKGYVHYICLEILRSSDHFQTVWLPIITENTWIPIPLIDWKPWADCKWVVDLCEKSLFGNYPDYLNSLYLYYVYWVNTKRLIYSYVCLPWNFNFILSTRLYWTYTYNEQLHQICFTWHTNGIQYEYNGMII